MSYISLLETTLQSVSDNDLLRMIVEKWRSSSKFWRITTLAIASYSALCAVRYIYIKSKRRYYGHPPGPIALPFSIFLNPRVNILFSLCRSIHSFKRWLWYIVDSWIQSKFLIDGTRSGYPRCLLNMEMLQKLNRVSWWSMTPFWPRNCSMTQERVCSCPLNVMDIDRDIEAHGLC